MTAVADHWIVLQRHERETGDRWSREYSGPASGEVDALKRVGAPTSQCVAFRPEDLRR